MLKISAIKSESKIMPDQIEAPLRVTVFLFAYNQEEYIEEACRSVLGQVYSPLEIIFSDDCSTDQTFERMRKVVDGYDGPHRVTLNRNSENMGLIRHVNHAFEISQGDLIVAAAGDDISMPNRVKALVEAYLAGGRKALVIHSSAKKISPTGEELGLFVPPVVAQKLTLSDMSVALGIYLGASGAWSRSIYDEFGPIDSSEVYEDLILGYRAALKSAMCYVDEPLLMYRVGAGMSTQSRGSRFDFAAKIAHKRRTLRRNVEVYRQRLKDLARVPMEGAPALRLSLLKEMETQRMKLLFYTKPSDLLVLILSKCGLSAFRIFISETRYLLLGRPG